MDLRFVETLLATIDGGSIAAAARAQGITAAAATQRVGALEAELKVSLLQRNGRNMAATPACETILSDLREMLALRAGLEAELAREVLSGTLRLGAISTALGEFGSSIIASLGKSAPDLELKVFPGGSQATYESFTQRTVDMALVVKPPFELPKTVRFDSVVRHPIGLVRPRDAPRDIPFVIYARDSWGGKLCFDALTELHNTPRVLCEMDAVEAIAQLVAEGVGQAVLPWWDGLQRNAEALNFEPIVGHLREVGLVSWQREIEKPVNRLVREALGLC
ncbi:LysR family transcriptional regulator [Shimia isoporae]|uniref:LysR family transcriptional regulator n=1 Tax=Shimia isoporae TaxID=647720 RepID=A0A4R1N1Y4_9RHOB|nr:LysR family transcriptional regulator [Shimia isoporae]TCK98942.1 LysR family transcriptional regulator [Shimia isoporae]